MAARRPDGLTSRMLSRDLLSRRLHSLPDERGVAMHHGRRLVTARYDGNRIVAEFDDGTAAVGDVLVGADGLWSRTRTLIDPGATVRHRHDGRGTVLLGDAAPAVAPSAGQGASRLRGHHIDFSERVAA